MKKILSTTLLGLFHCSANALTISIDAELLKDADGFAMPITGLVVLTAGVSNTFFGPTATDFAGGDEMVLQKWDLSSFSTPGVFSNITTDITYTGALNEGDPLKLYWYPTLTLASTAPGVGTIFGAYSDAMGVDGSAPWAVGAESDTISLKFFTTDSVFLNLGGSNDALAGNAQHLVAAPEPSLSLLVLLSAGAVTARRRRVWIGN